MMKILLVEDDPDLLDVTAYSLRREGFLVVEASDAAQALQRLKVDRPDLVVLDLGLPRTDGHTVLQRIQGRDSTPVLVLTGRNAEQDVIKAFALGADDYVVKPFVAKQLAMRIRAILRRTNGGTRDQSQPTLDVGGLHIDPEIQEITWHGKNIRLTPTEFRILHLLASHVGRSVATNRLLTYVWGYEDGDANALRTHISHLRTKLQLGQLIDGTINAVTGVGYRFQLAYEPAQVDTVSTEALSA